LPAVPGGANSTGGASGPDGGFGANGGGGVPGGAGVALAVLLTLVLLRLARRADVKPVWRSYLPEVPPA
jgi:hypothetical protein